MTAAFVLGCGMSDAVDDDDGATAICEEDVDDTGCDVCIKTGCCETYATCQDDPTCACVLACSTEHQTREQCATRCNASAAELADVLTLLSGQNQTCSVQCEDACDVYAFDDDDDDGGP